MAFSVSSVAAVLLCIVCLSAAAQAPWTSTQFPQDKTQWWWDDGWWERGRIPAPANHEVGTRDARVIVYPGVGRAFDFRPREVRTFADGLATQDALRRTAEFIRRHLP